VEAVTSGWRFVHIGTEGDGVTIDGISVWDMRWVPTRHRITVAHPQWPNERHVMWTYRVDAAGRAVDFAAGEFSNGVWGFFVPDRVNR
jgi:hypothetical protein